MAELYLLYVGELISVGRVMMSVQRRSTRRRSSLSSSSSCWSLSLQSSPSASSCSGGKTRNRPKVRINCFVFTVRCYTSAVFAMTLSFEPAQFGRRAFSVCGPDIWNSLPVNIRLIDSHPSFRRALKTHIFNIVFT